MTMNPLNIWNDKESWIRGMSSGLNSLNNFRMSLNMKRESGTLLLMDYLEDIHYFLTLETKIFGLKTLREMYLHDI